MFMATREERNETHIRLSLVEEVVLEEKKSKKKEEVQEEEEDVQDGNKKKKKKQNDVETSTVVTSDKQTLRSSEVHPVKVEIVPLLFPQHTSLVLQSTIHEKDADRVRKVPGNMHTVSHLFQAIYQGRLRDVLYCLRFVNLESCEDNGRTPLMAALFVRNDSTRRRILEALVKNGALHDLKLTDNEKQRDLLGWCALLGRAQEFERLTELFDGDIDYYHGDVDGSTYLHLAVQSGNIAMVDTIIREMRISGLAIDHCSDKLGLTPYILARRLGYAVIAEKLHLQGRASVQKHDNKDFLSPRQWSIIGHRQRAHDRILRDYGARLVPPAVTLLEEIELEPPPPPSKRGDPCTAVQLSRSKSLVPPLELKDKKLKIPQRSLTDVVHSFLELWSVQHMPSYRENATEKVAKKKRQLYDKKNVKGKSGKAAITKKSKK